MSPVPPNPASIVNKTDLETLTDIRIQEAAALLTANLYNGAYYLAGYAVECALKACIAKQVQQYDFPDKKLATDSYTHDLASLIRVAKLQIELENEERSNAAFKLHWTIVKDWNETYRYVGNISQRKAQELFESVNDPLNGVLIWVKKFW